MHGIPYLYLIGHVIGKISSKGLKKPAQTRTAHLLHRIVATMLFVTLTGGVWAADTELTPRIGVGAAYDDNIFMSAEDKVNSSILTVSPGIDFNYETLLSKLSFKADWDILNYLDESDLNRTNHFYHLSGDQRIKERWTASADVRYYRDTTLNSYLQETGRVSDRIERDYLDAGAEVAYDWSTVSGVSLAYQYENATYDGDLYPDYDTHHGRLYYYHHLKNEVDTLSIGPSYYHRVNDLNDVDSYSLDLGWDRNWSAITRSDASIGARYTKVKDVNGEEDDTWGAKARFDLMFTGQVSTLAIRYFHDLRTTTEGADVNVDNFYVTYNRLLTERFGMGLDGRLVFSYKLLSQESNVNDSRYYWLEPRLFYRLTPHLEASLKYRYQNNVDFLDEGDVTSDRNIVWFELTYGMPFKL